MNLLKFSGVAILLLVLTLQVSAVDYNLSGHVLDSSGSTVASATVQVVGVSSTTSDAGGYYLFPTVVKGNHTVYAVKSGYYRQVRSINLYQDTVQNFTLSAPNYTTSDMDDIMIDTMATGMVEVKDDVPTLVDLGVLYLIMSLLLLIITGAIAIFYIVPKTLGVTKSKR